MIKENALVSVIMPVYNGEKYVAQALENVFKQNYQPFVQINNSKGIRTIFLPEANTPE